MVVVGPPELRRAMADTVGALARAYGSAYGPHEDDVVAPRQTRPHDARPHDEPDGTDDEPPGRTARSGRAAARRGRPP
ncbi:hypothetical protein ACFQ60_05425 [Streptomyces zhihengii]